MLTVEQEQRAEALADEMRGYAAEHDRLAASLPPGAAQDQERATAEEFRRDARYYHRLARGEDF